MMSPDNFRDWCIERHRNTDHFYDKYLPYEFHLRMVVNVFHDFKHLIHIDKHELIEKACWGHDLIEDTRTNFNDIVSVDCKDTANIIYALTNEKGRNRAERGNDTYYKGINETPGAKFCKLCDRIANVQYSKMAKSPMFEMYRKENDDFIKKLTIVSYVQMQTYLSELFNT